MKYIFAILYICCSLQVFAKEIAAIQKINQIVGYDSDGKQLMSIHSADPIRAVGHKNYLIITDNLSKMEIINDQGKKIFKTFGVRSYRLFSDKIGISFSDSSLKVYSFENFNKPLVEFDNVSSYFSFNNKIIATTPYFQNDLLEVYDYKKNLADSYLMTSNFLVSENFLIVQRTDSFDPTLHFFTVKSDNSFLIYEERGKNLLFSNSFVSFTDDMGLTKVINKSGNVLFSSLLNVSIQLKDNYFVVTEDGYTQVFDKNGSVIVAELSVKSKALGENSFALVDNTNRLTMYDLRGHIVHTSFNTIRPWINGDTLSYRDGSRFLHAVNLSGAKQSVSFLDGVEYTASNEMLIIKNRTAQNAKIINLLTGQVARELNVLEIFKTYYKSELNGIFFK